MNVGIIVFPGTNCDLDTKRACEYLGWDVEFIWHDEMNLNNFELVILPGGFSYGDYISAGRLAKFSPVMNSLKNYIKNKKGAVLGICNGFQILCESGILPGSLMVNEKQKFICDVVDLEFSSNASVKNIKLPIAHKEGAYVCSEKVLQQIKNQKMSFLKYKNNPNGSIFDIAGIIDVDNKIIGMMPHPERAVFRENSNQDGLEIFKFIEGLIKC